ncbi:MAG: UDP-N-acetylmuramate dehydrogenase [Phycisphaerales bacterium]
MLDILWSMPKRLRTEREIVASLVDDLEVIVEYDAAIGRDMTWYGIGGNADTLVRPRTVNALRTLLRRAREESITVRVLGSGANLLVDDDGVDGIVVHLDEAPFREASTIHRHRKNRGGAGEAGDGARIMAGASMERLVIRFALDGMSGIEMMAGVPSSLGGAIRMNAGGKFGSIGDAVAAVGALDLDGRLVVHPAEELEFGYRRTSLIEPVILWAELKLTPDDPKRVHERVKEIFKYKKSSQPMGEASAGCVFKNPPSPQNPQQRMSAGELIDRAGLKGLSKGGAMISERHANFFVAREGASARDLIQLIELAVSRVRDQFGVELRRELVVWRRKDAAGEAGE